MAAGLEMQGAEILKLNVGEPDFATPEHIAEAARRAIADGKTRYTAAAGTPALREAAAEKFRAENRIPCGPENVIAGTGAKQLIFNAILATVEPGDEVLIPTPSWVSYPEMVKIAGGTPIPVPCAADTGFKITAAMAEQRITRRTRWILLNSPCNPTGAVYSAREYAGLAEVLRRHPGISVMCDDIYEKIIFDGIRFSTFAEAAPGLASRTLTVNGVSKSHAMTGWRIGFAAGPADLISAMTKLQSQSTTNPSSVSQAAALAALTEKEESARFIEMCNAAYQRRRDRVTKMLSAVDGLSLSKPEGAFYSFVECRKLFGKTDADGQPIGSDADFCGYLLHSAGVSVVPGSEFGAPGYFRLSFAASDETLEAACARIRNAVENLR